MEHIIKKPSYCYLDNKVNIQCDDLASQIGMVYFQLCKQMQKHLGKFIGKTKSLHYGENITVALDTYFLFYQAGYNQNYKAAEKSGVNR